MNKRGHPDTLVASHRGNRNAEKHGLYSERAIAERAASIEAELLQAFEFTQSERISLREYARIEATIRTIDDMLEGGVLTKTGKSGYLLDHRARLSKQLRLWLSDISEAMNRQDARELASGSRIDIALELEREVVASKPNPVRISALTALDRVRRQPPLPPGPDDIPNVIRQHFDQ